VIDQYPSPNGVLTSLIWRKTMSGGETSLSGYDNASQALSYTPGQEQVYLNGILLVRGDDYTATNGTSITGLSALSASDFVQVNCYNNFSLASLPSTSITGEISNSQITSLATSKLTGTISNAQLAGSISNDKLANSSITINGSAVSLGGSVSLPGDIESVTASSPLTGGGTSGAVTIGIQSASTSQSGAVQLTDSTSSTSTTTAATPASVKSAYDLANAAIPKNLTTTTGDIIYASGANTPARLGIGSTGQVLTVSGGVPSWASAASGGGQTLITTSSFPTSGTATHTISSIPTTYKHLLIIIKGVKAGTGSDGVANFTMQFNGDTGANYAGYATGSTAGGSIGATNLNINARLFNSADAHRQNYAIIDIPRYTDTDARYISSVSYGIDQNTTPWAYWNSQVYKGSSAITSITFTAGANYAGGTAYVYGVS